MNFGVLSMSSNFYKQLMLGTLAISIANQSLAMMAPAKAASTLDTVLAQVRKHKGSLAIAAGVAAGVYCAYQYSDIITQQLRNVVTPAFPAVAPAVNHDIVLNNGTSTITIQVPVYRFVAEQSQIFPINAITDISFQNGTYPEGRCIITGTNRADLLVRFIKRAQTQGHLNNVFANAAVNVAGNCLTLTTWHGNNPNMDGIVDCIVEYPHGTVFTIHGVQG